MGWLEDLIRFYEILGDLENRVGGKHKLSECTGKMGWAQRGVYFFFETGEIRSQSGNGLRVVRVGTHAISNSKLKQYGSAQPAATDVHKGSTFWGRLRMHRGSSHRGSVFRLLVGAAIKRRDSLPDIES